MDAAVHKPSRNKLQTLMAGCAQVCPELSRDLAIPATDRAGGTPIVEACGGFCTEAARAAWQKAVPGRAYAALIAECGPESYGLTSDSSPLLSASWLFLLRADEWLQRHRRDASTETLALLEDAGMHAHFALPLPAQLDGGYRLPEARSTRVMDHAFYVIVEPIGPDGGPPPTRAAAVPVARLRPHGLEQRPLPGGYFPGKVVRPPDDDFQARHRMLQGMYPGSAHSNIDPTPAVLIDRAARVGALRSAMVALDQTEIALAVFGHTARVHSVAVHRPIGGTGAGLPILTRGDNGYRLRSKHAAGAPSSVVDIAAGADAPARLARALEALAPTSERVDALTVSLPDEADISALVAVLDLCASAGVERVFLPDAS